MPNTKKTPNRSPSAQKTGSASSAILRLSKGKEPAGSAPLKVVKKNSAISQAAKDLVVPAPKKPARKPSVVKAATFTSKVEFKPAPLPAASTKEIPKTDPKLEQNLAKKPAGSLQSSLRLFQIYYEPWQKELLDPNFAALDNSKNKSELMEFSVFEQLSKSDYVKGAELWGALSWRFTEKTGMSGADWVKNIQANPGCDIYYCDPYPVNEALFHNMWTHGETCHPQFLALCQAIFQVAGLPAEELTSVSPSNEFSAANYFVGSPKFWAAYLPWVAGILSAANKKLPPKVRPL